jgi:DNA modification methylase
MEFEDMINTIQLGDCYELIKTIPDKSVDLIIIDPPYEYTTGGGAGCFGIKKRKYHQEYYDVSKNTQKYNSNRKKHVWEDKKKIRKELQFISSGFDYSLLNELDRIMKATNIYIWCSKHQIYLILKYYLEKHCNIEILTWHKTNPIPTCNNTYLNDTEYCIFARQSGVKVRGTISTKMKYYISPANIYDKSLYKHPTIKPINIIKNLIINSSQENDIVLDCFCGSGTTCVASKELNRRFIGIEINEEYHKIACDRLNGITADGQITIFTNFEQLEMSEDNENK